MPRRRRRLGGMRRNATPRIISLATRNLRASLKFSPSETRSPPPRGKWVRPFQDRAKELRTALVLSRPPWTPQLLSTRSKCAEPQPFLGPSGGAFDKSLVIPQQHRRTFVRKEDALHVGIAAYLVLLFSESTCTIFG